MTNSNPELENFTNEVFELLSLVQPEKTRHFLHNVVHIAEKINKIVVEECNNIADKTKEQINSQLRLYKYSEYQLFSHMIDFFCIYLELDVAGVIELFNKIKPGLTKVMHIRSTIIILKQNIDYFELHKKHNSVAPKSE